jgi:hypothetical protein
MGFFCILAVLVLASGCASSHPPCLLPHEAFYEADHRFVARLLEFVALDAAGDCEAQFEYLTPHQRELWGGVESYCDKVHRHRPFTVDAFVPDLLPGDLLAGDPETELGDHGIGVFGCAHITLLRNGDEREVRMDLGARLIDGEWLFADFSIWGPIGTGGEPCELGQCLAIWSARRDDSEVTP